MGGRILAIGVAACSLLGHARAADLTVMGCNERNAGEIGVRELVGDIGDTVGVAVTVNTVTDVDAFGVDLTFPTNLLTHVRTDPGNLVATWATFSGTFVPARGVVRIGGFDVTPIPAGTVGRLAVVHFEIMTAGADSFSTGNAIDDLLGYVSCESVHVPTAARADSWGRVKALYR